MPQILLHEQQAAFKDSKAPFRGFTGGRGAGKSFIGAYDIICRVKPGRLYMVVAPNYPMLRDSSLRSFQEICVTLGITYKFNKTTLTAVMPNGATIVFKSAENPDTLRGPNLSGVWMDECSVIPTDAAFKILIACLREGGEQGWLSATFTPKGKQHWTYKEFGTGKPGRALFKCSTWDNPFLSEEFIETLKGSYTSAMAEQELKGEFMDLGAGVFSRHWFKIVPMAPSNARRMRYWDKAGTDDGGCFTCGVLMAMVEHDGDRDKKEFWVEHVVRKQLSALKRNELMKQTTYSDKEKYGSVEIMVEQEPGSGGKESAEVTVRMLAGFKVFLDKPSGEKAERAQPLAAQAEAGNVSLVAGNWNEEYLDELDAFPGGPYADQVDASSGAFNRLTLVRKKVFRVFT